MEQKNKKPNWLIEGAKLAQDPFQYSLPSGFSSNPLYKMRVRLLLLCESKLKKDEIIENEENRPYLSVERNIDPSKDTLKIYIIDNDYAKKLASAIYLKHSPTASWIGFSTICESALTEDATVYNGLITITGAKNIVHVLLEDFKVSSFDMRTCLNELNLTPKGDLAQRIYYANLISIRLKPIAPAPDKNDSRKDETCVLQ